MRVKLVELGGAGVTVTGRTVGEVVIPYEGILTAERPAHPRRGLLFHVQGTHEPAGGIEARRLVQT